MKFLLLTVFILSLVAPSFVRAQGYGCEANIEDERKRDCYPDPGSNEQGCRARNCVWCPASNPTLNVPWCFFHEGDGGEGSTSPPGPPPGYGCDDGYLPEDERVDCAPGEPTNEMHCRNKNCTWCPASEGGNVPWCYIPGAPSPGGYYMVGEPIQLTNGLRVNLIKAVQNESFTFARNRLQNRPFAWEGEAETLTLDAEFQSNYRLRVKIYNTTQRYEVPLQIQAATGGSQNPLYEIQFQNDPLFSFKVIRKSTGTVLFDSSPGKFIFADQYLTMSWTPASENVYGIGENEQTSFKHDFSKNITWALWGRDQPPDFTANMYGTQPYYTVLENDGNAHSVAIVNSNAQQFAMVSGPVIRYTTIGGLLDFYFFLGPTPENTVEQYTEAVGRPQMPPYWALGFQLCRYGYNKIENMKAAVDRTAQYGIPHDVQYGDIDIMHKALDFTYSRENFPGLPEYIRELKTRGIKFMTILDPCISIAENPEEYRPLKLGNEMDVWVKKPDGSPVIGKVWPQDPVYFPDYSKEETKEWWKILIREFHDLLEYDGLWIDMNEPANFVDGDINEGCPSNNLNNPPFVPSIIGRYLPSKTLCSDHMHAAGSHYDTHNLYGWFQSEPTLTGTREGTGKRALVLSRSTYLGSGHWVAHWLGDNWSKWNNLHFSIIGMLQYNQFGVPFVGSDICGFIGESNADMCQRWMELGAFYPFSRNHNGIDYRDQDPGAFGPAVAESSKNALLVRYTLLPYLYTLFYNSVTRGSTVARALWHEFPTDTNTWGIDRQFMWGSGLLISPVLDEGALQVQAYFPEARFYDYFTGSEEASRGGQVTIPTPMDKINIHVRGGNVLPTQEPAVNTEISRNNPMGLIVALDEEGTAQGQLFYDDGDSIGTIENDQVFLASFAVTNKALSSTVIKNGYSDMTQKRINTVRLLGAGTVSQVLLNGAPHTSFTQKPSGEVEITNLGINPTTSFTLSWS